MKQYLELLVKREARELMGRRFSNLWILVLMLVATFASIAFSEGSKNILEAKMCDPFTNWVNISRMSDDNHVDDVAFKSFRDSLFDEGNKERFDYSDVLMSMQLYHNMWGYKGGDYIISMRFFEHLNTPLIHEVLKPSNIVEGCRVDSAVINDKTMGLIISISAARKLGYDESHLPAYVNILKNNEGADTFGLKLVSSHNEYLPIALPVLAVVKRLPGNVQTLSGMFLYEQLQNGAKTNPFDFVYHAEEYLRKQQLAFYVTDSIETVFRDFVQRAVPDSLRSSLSIMENNGLYQSMRSWKPGNILEIGMGDGLTSMETYQQLANSIESQFTDQNQVCRVFHFETGESETPSSQYISVEFRSLSHIHEFEAYANDHSIQLEMELVHSKENFMAVATVARILSAAMVIFSIVCIIMFMVNMLQGYFQKVKRNIGTFKAFGMNGRELIKAYVLLLIGIVCTAVVLALLITWGLQGLLFFMGYEKDGFNYLCLWNNTTYVATAVIFTATILTVIIVMARLLSQTPGDLIYDR